MIMAAMVMGPSKGWLLTAASKINPIPAMAASATGSHFRALASSRK
jgi:hypothetical protein